jgi:arginyl-tRNA synthetase
MNIHKLVKQEIFKILQKLYPELGEDILNKISVETPKDSTHGDLATNAAMVSTKELKIPPREIGEKLVPYINEIEAINSCEIAGPGFINMRLNSKFLQNLLLEIIERGKEYGCSNIGAGREVNLEFVSTNPTGPIHIGHATGAIFGDALAKLLSKNGYKVTKEYYINDAGSQIDILVKSLHIRYLEVVTGEQKQIPEGLYPGEYLKPVANKLYEDYGDSLRSLEASQNRKIIEEFAISSIMKLIKDELELIGVRHDIYKSEKELHNSGLVEKAISKLQKQGLIYEGKLDAPEDSSFTQEDSENKQLLFATSNYGDDKDRVACKAGGDWTYLAGDLAYADDKLSRGFEEIIMVLGADHSGYVKRLESAYRALSDDKITPDIKLCQLVTLMKNGEPLKMSKRAGNFLTLKDVYDEIGKDILRFMMLSRKQDAPLEFDIEKVKKQSKDNPVFYVQYAHVRCHSVVETIKTKYPEILEITRGRKADLSLLERPEEEKIIKLLADWPSRLEGAVLHREPHRVVYYLKELAAEFHRLWNLGKEDSHFKFIQENNIKLTAARLVLTEAVSTVIKNGFDIIGIKPLEKM